jgi:hypothetical protein
VLITMNLAVIVSPTVILRAPQAQSSYGISKSDAECRSAAES